MIYLSPDLQLIAGEFFDCNLPKHRQYLFRYFKSDIQRQFVRYYHTFGSIEHFSRHTGYFCKKRWLQVLVVRFNKFESILTKARANFDFATVAIIESGKYKGRDKL